MTDKPENRTDDLHVSPLGYKKHYDQQAFPVATDDVVVVGMTLRDYFAGQALCGLSFWLSQNRQEKINNKESRAEWEASMAYKLADAMLSERTRDKE